MAVVSATRVFGSPRLPKNRTTSSALSTTGGLRGSLANGIRSGISPWRELRAS
jgi:hypothetical protein